MSGSKQSQASPCPPDCRFEDAQGYCSYRQIMGACRSLIAGAEHPGPDCACYEPADGQPKPRDLPRPARREPTGYVHRPTAAVSLQNDSRALELYRSGASDREIADATGWGKSTVAKWRRDSGLPGNRKGVSLTQREAEVIRLYDLGHSDLEIAGAIGCSTCAVFHWRRRTGRPANHRPGWQKGRTRKGEKTNGNTQHDSG